ncbi:MAG: hypothetical protein WC859_03300 [Elusimicrobiota bacterium]|jgi:hypothetical protein
MEEDIDWEKRLRTLRYELSEAERHAAPVVDFYRESPSVRRAMQLGVSHGDMRAEVDAVLAQFDRGAILSKKLTRQGVAPREVLFTVMNFLVAYPDIIRKNLADAKKRNSDLRRELNSTILRLTRLRRLHREIYSWLEAYANWRVDVKEDVHYWEDFNGNTPRFPLTRVAAVLNGFLTFPGKYYLNETLKELKGLKNQAFPRSKPGEGEKVYWKLVESLSALFDKRMGRKSTGCHVAPIADVMSCFEMNKIQEAHISRHMKKKAAECA